MRFLLWAGTYNIHRLLPHLWGGTFHNEIQIGRAMGCVKLGELLTS